MILCSTKHEHCAHWFTGFARVLCEISLQLLCRPSNHSLFEGLAMAVHCLETDTSFSAIIELSITYYVDFSPFHFGYCSLPIIQNDMKLFGSKLRIRMIFLHQNVLTKFYCIPCETTAAKSQSTTFFFYCACLNVHCYSR